MFAQLAVASILAAAPLARAAQNVTVKALPSDDCSSYPGYNAATNTAGPWILQVVDSDNVAIEGFGDTSVYSISYNPRVDSKPTLRWGYITFPTNNQLAKTALKCDGGVLKALVNTDLTAAGAPTNAQWSELLFPSNAPYDAPLLYKITDGIAPQIFEHYVDGVKQDGVFLGAYDNSTRWGFKYNPANVGSYGLDFYYARILGPNSADPVTGSPLKANETTAFIKIRA
ncbi:uncharacterized protein F4812DRAFT_436584 [Daldinia caldariorum]|uniref:uncharacterized protein n=1 Tax=Daldinia caldariorum TaxID=326644 RepID=UPI0020086C70|nr:uncharacterized protein F4812DRAFT_436584 [Daldinia caldariorum]KAI1466267.1 hypothetical protein F4812DRAFT_436584 [Daldinia caldariorum]